jgi:hypothetical protein
LTTAAQAHRSEHTAALSERSRSIDNEPQPTKKHWRRWIKEAEKEAKAARIKHWRLLVTWKGDHWETAITSEDLYLRHVHAIDPARWTAVGPEARDQGPIHP